MLRSFLRLEREANLSRHVMSEIRTVWYETGKTTYIATVDSDAQQVHI